MTDPNAKVVVVGGGHNGLVCAAYLARAGRQVEVLEAAGRVGGAAVTREFTPGYSVSSCSHILHLLDPRIVKDLDLRMHGLELAARNLSTLALCESGEHLKISGSTLEGNGIPEGDRAALPAFQQRMARFAGSLRTCFAKRPPRLVNGGLADNLTLLKLGLDIRLLGRERMRELLRIIAINIFDVLEENFAGDLLKGALGFDAVLGNHMGPRSPNSVLTYLYRISGELDGRNGALSIPKGGMGAVSTALAAAAEARGARIRTDAPVARIVTEPRGVTGVELADGELIPAGVVISNADPKTTFLKLVGAPHIEAGFTRRIHNIRMHGNAAKVHLALDGLPSFTRVDESDLGHRLVIAPDPAYVERAFDHAKYGEYSREPAIEITLPSVHDASLAPAGKHVLSAVVQYAPYRLKGGWDEARDAFTRTVIERIGKFAPDIQDRITATEVLTPVDIEREFRITGGHWNHGELAFDSFLMMRPVPGAAQYATPLPGLYLCGAGAHPGGGVTGLPGRNAAHEVIAREKAA